MDKKNVVEQINEQIDTILKERGGELAKIIASIRDTQAAIDEQEGKIQAAVAAGDLKAYTAASEKMSSLKRQLEMYTRRQTYFRDNSGITDDETEEVIDRIFDYEDEEEKAFENAVREPLKQLEKAATAYREKISAAEKTIARWTASIRPNYRSQGTIYRETGTNRSITPIPVRPVPFYGCDLSEKIERWISYEDVRDVLARGEENV